MELSVTSKLLLTLVAFEFIYIFFLETIVTTSANTARVFKMTQEELSRKSVSTLFKNQGIYNLLIAILLLYSVYFSKNSRELSILLLLYIIAVAAYGSISSDILILLKQGGLAILALFNLLVIKF